MISLIILTAVINTLAQDVSNVDLLASLPSQSLQCSLKFDRNFIATNEELAAAIEALVEENASEESGASRRDRPCDSDEATEADQEDATTEEELQARRALRGGKGRGRGGRRNRDVTLEAGATRPPRGDKPCDSDSDDTTEDSEEDVADEPATEEDVQLRRALRGGKGRGRGGRRNRDVTLEAGATRPPRGDKPCDSDSDDTTEDSESVADEGDNEELQLRRALRGGKGRGRGGRRNRDVTLEAGATRPPRGDKPCDSDSDDTTEDSEADEPATEEDVQLRRALRGGKGRGRGGRRNRDVTLEAGATRPPRGDKPCDSDSDDSSEETGSTDEPVTEESLLRRLLRRGRDSSETDAEVAGETDATDEPCRRRGRGHGRRNRRKDTDTETPEEETDGAARRALGGRGKRSRGLDAAISNGSIDFAGLTGEVVFGEVDEELESVPLTVTVGGTSFNCDVEVRRGNKVSCRAISQDDFHLRVGCEILADEE